MDWEELKIVIAQYRENANRDLRYSASEENYINSNATISMISKYVDENSNGSGVPRIFLFASVVCIVVLVIAIFLNAHKELQINKERSKDMHLDVATGIYNQAKCHEVLKTSHDNRKKEMAVIVFDLNDLKKTNDGLGHRAGDQLIYDFAQQIKNATMKFENEIFVGRYGGDEFMTFLDEIEERDVKNYIDNVYKILKEFNETQGRPYQLSCAAGYGITSEENRSATAKELFDIADEDMFKNKIAMKEKKKQELLAQGIEVEEHVDDRLS